MVDTSKFHVFSNGTDIIFGETVMEAIEAYCWEIGESPEDYTIGPRSFTQVDGSTEITVHEEDGKSKTTMTAGQWIESNVANANGSKWFSRLIGSTEV